MDILDLKANMRTRTALFLFFTAAVAGGVLTLLVDALAETETKPKLIRVQAPPAEVASTGSKQAADPNWREFAAGMDEAEGSDKLVLVDVYTDWCGWCKRMDRTTYRDSLVLDFLDRRYVTVKINAESKEPTQYRGEGYTYRELAGGFGVRSYPTTLFLEADGSPITTVPGYWKPEDFIIILHFIADRHYKDTKFGDFSKAWKAKNE